MGEDFSYDVFLSHSSRDKPVVRQIAARLRDDGVHVWFDEWEIKPGDSIPGKIEEGLEHSRVLVLCMSANAFGSDWARLEAGTFRFRDPLNKERRFIPLRLDDAPIKGSLAQFLYVDWRPAYHEEEYAQLLDACRSAVGRPQGAEVRPRFRCTVLSFGHTASVWSVALSADGSRGISGSNDKTVRLWDVESGRCLRVLEGHTESVWSVALSTVRRVLSGADDNTMRVWDWESGRCLRILEGHAAGVRSVALSADGRVALSGAFDKTVRVWDMDSGCCLRVLEGHTESVRSVALSADGRRALSGAFDGTVRLWDVESGRCLRVLEGHTVSVNSVAWSADGRHCLSGAFDGTVRLWDVESGRCLRVLEGHTVSVNSVAWSTDRHHGFSGASDSTVRIWDVDSGSCLHLLEGHTRPILSVALSPDGHRALSGAKDKAVRFWDVGSGRCVRVLDGHTADVLSVALSGDGRRAVTGAADYSVRLWDVDSGWCLRVLQGHTHMVWSVGWSVDGGRVISGASDRTIRLWDVESGHCLRVLKGHLASLRSVALSADGRRCLSGADDCTVRVWHVESGRCLRVLEGHTDMVLSVGLSADGRRCLSGSRDKSVRIWDVESGRCLRVLEGHTDTVLSVGLSADGCRCLSGGDDNTVRLWDVDSGRCLAVLEGHSAGVRSVGLSADGRRGFSGAINGVLRVWELEQAATEIRVPQSITARIGDAGTPNQVEYTNAKVLLVGASGVGKTALSKRLASNEWQPSDSTVGAWATQWKLPVPSGGVVQREIWLWDFGGQADQRLIHQLYMEETALAVLVFDGQDPDLFETLVEWDRDLARASRKKFAKLLVAGRVDSGGLRESRSEVKKFARERNFLRFLETSAKQNLGCEELKQAILDGIKWEEIPCRTTEVLFKRLKDEVIRLRDEGRVLLRFKELREALQLRLPRDFQRFTDEQLRAVLSLLAGPGVVWELKFGSWVLLQPERINAYAQAVIRTLQADEDQRGCVMEERILNRELVYESSMTRLQGDEERFVLLAMHQTLVERGLCLRQPTEKGNLLIFPSYYRRERPDQVGHPAVLVSYRFTGFLDEIYATLVVRLHYSEAFKQDHLWRYAADFKTNLGKKLGVKLTRRAASFGELEVYFDPAIPTEEKIIFSKYVHQHLEQHAQDVERLRHYVCPHCGTPVGNREVAMRRLDDWLENRSLESVPARGSKSRKRSENTPRIICVECEEHMPLWDDLEQCFASPDILQRVRDLEEESAIVLDNESKERALVGEVISTVALAGQISREFNVSDHGIDMEIEFKDDNNDATGQKLYLQLKSGDSYLRERKFDGSEIFAIRDERHAHYWMAQKFPVLLVIRNSEGEVRWMEVRDWLKRARIEGKKPPKQIIFRGERFDVMSVRRWREKALEKSVS